MLALMFLATQIRDRDPEWAAKMRRVAGALTPGTLKIRDTRRHKPSPYAEKTKRNMGVLAELVAANASGDAERVKKALQACAALVDSTDVIGG